MTKLQFPPFKRESAQIKNVNDLFAQNRSFGAQAADRVASVVGSWRFIIYQSLVMLVWLIVNGIAWKEAWDPYPFILMNLILSTQAAFTAPIIMMSQNRQAEKDRIEAHNDYLTDQRAAAEIELILKQLEAQNRALVTLHTMLVSIEMQLQQSQDGSQHD